MDRMATSPMSPENLEPHLFIPEEDIMGNAPEAKREGARSPEELQKVLSWVRENQLGSYGYDLKDLGDAMEAGINPKEIRAATRWAESVHEGEQASLRSQMPILDRTKLWTILDAYFVATHPTNQEAEQALQDARIQATSEANVGKGNSPWEREGLTYREWLEQAKQKAAERAQKREEQKAA
jgi:hypothetical protein